MLFKKLKQSFFSSGHNFKEEEDELKSLFQIINIAILLSSVAMIYGIVLNLIKGTYPLMEVELGLLFANIILFSLLRRSVKYYNLVANLLTAQFTALILYLIYSYDPTEMKHVWLYTYPIILLYYKNKKIGFYWVIFMISMIMVHPLLPNLHSPYTLYQSFYISFVLIIVSLIVYMYKQKMSEAKRLILRQKLDLNKKVEELTQKDKLLTTQSKQAVMGEMISMIAHQWRQPLSTVTLSISNIQVKKLLNKQVDEKELDAALENISDTVVYLSETIDDFQTYFNPNRKLTHSDMSEIIEKVLNFISPRLKEHDITVEKKLEGNLKIATYANELVQVLLNIVNNAIDELISRRIDRPKIKIAVKELAEDILISIEDNAGGVEDIALQSIFEPYISTKGKNGTGLGLYMSQMIMQKQFDSHLCVETTENGLIFGMNIPKKLA